MLAKTTTLFGYQEETIERLKQLYAEKSVGAILALGPGLGKTLISLLVGRHIIQKETAFKQRPLPILVVTEISPLQDWVLACSKHFSPALHVECLGNKTTKSKAAALQSWHVLQRADVIITNYEMLVQFYLLSSSLSEKPRLTGATDGSQVVYAQRWPVVLLDEAHKIRNDSTHVYSAVRSVDAVFKMGLSATPCNNDAFDVLAILRGLNICGEETYDAEIFRRACTQYIIRGDANLSTTRQHYRPTDIVLRRKFATAEEQRDYDSIHDVHVLTRIVRQRQYCSGAKSTSKTKVMMLYDYIEHVVVARREKIVVLCEFRDSVVMIATELEARFDRRLRVFKADGLSSQAERSAKRDLFTNCYGAAVLVSTGIFGQGVNLEAANHIVCFDGWWNPVPDDQGRSRVERPGQTRSVFSVRLLIEGTIEDGVWMLAQKKRKMIARVLSGEFIDTSSSSSSTLSVDDEVEESASLVNCLTRELIESTCDLYVEDTSTLASVVPDTIALTSISSSLTTTSSPTATMQQEKRQCIRRSWHVNVEDMVTRSSRKKPLRLKYTSAVTGGSGGGEEDDDSAYTMLLPSTLSTRKRSSR